MSTELPIIVKTQDDELLGYIITDMDVDYLEELIDESFDTHKYNYDIRALLHDIRAMGYEAYRTHLVEIKI